MLIAYFSWGGNTRGIAREIERQTGEDLFEIEMVTPYSADYNTVLDQAQNDQNIQARPELANHVEDISQYDIVILGYPKLEYGFNCVSCVLSGIFKSDRTVYTGICALCVCCLHR